MRPDGLLLEDIVAAADAIAEFIAGYTAETLASIPLVRGVERPAGRIARRSLRYAAPESANGAPAAAGIAPGTLTLSQSSLRSCGSRPAMISRCRPSFFGRFPMHFALATCTTVARLYRDATSGSSTFITIQTAPRAKAAVTARASPAERYVGSQNTTSPGPARWTRGWKSPAANRMSFRRKARAALRRRWSR